MDIIEHTFCFCPAIHDILTKLANQRHDGDTEVATGFLAKIVPYPISIFNFLLPRLGGSLHQLAQFR